jgi:hypothetical protein
MRQRFLKEVAPRLPKHGIELVGVFVAPEEDGKMTYVTRCADEEARKNGWASEWMTCTSIPCLASHRASQNPSRPASKATAMRAMVQPLPTASSRQRMQQAQECSFVRCDFLQRPGTVPAINQLDWLNSMTATRVVSCSNGTRDLS